MKTLEEKKLLVKMARMLGQPVESSLIESIEKEEKLLKTLFKEEKENKPVKVKENKPVSIVDHPVVKEEVQVEAPKPVDYLNLPKQSQLIQQTMAAINTSAPKLATTLEKKELEGIKRTIAEMMQKIGTLSWGGGGTGIVSIWSADDLDRANAADGLLVQYNAQRKQFTFAPQVSSIQNTTIVETNSYVVQDSDWYIGVNYAGPVTITVPESSANGRNLVIKDESGNCSNNPITVSGPVDNDANGFILQVDNGGVHMLFRGNYWRII
jgi:hypothetical protein